MEKEKHNGLKVCVLASGSTGNSLYVESNKRKILVDAGLSGKKITNLMAKIGKDIKEVDTLLVTHEHRDHIHGVGVLARKYGMDVYANDATWKAMSPLIGDIKMEQKHHFEMGQTLTFDDVDVESFGVSHDAVAPQFYQFHSNKRSFVVLTDTGYVSEKVRGVIRDANAYLFESNHDLEMLRMGPYPWSVKQRILGDRGHLSNEDGALTMTDLIGDKTKRIYLGHLSKENNMKELAYLTMDRTLKNSDIDVGREVKLFNTDPEEPADLFTV